MCMWENLSVPVFFDDACNQSEQWSDVCALAKTSVPVFFTDACNQSELWFSFTARGNSSMTFVREHVLAGP